ncbi:bifunctional DNA-formamidopyrimidine glycosylase/DNA-(apurinic or apyrimidinic site) lyase [Neisseria animalis]|uniref:Formamidopyrimidine-DNA glycosylase n=1 Tax=Neisseria animalis TaxID=492 RepID=A0A5P3MTM4_NEIAN|nr:bifunctional DNA-formamidopyrimidine glycosylase/DNA-(apurinic or apyrimidinic site) lyase [Neisseria animalis]QEY24914.1 bifunctional DNA-formamidopyrimidine glycosylase/DNA-(apurinic or apyrimidinic site) lyase [Neisseria animalis]ROW33366.1 bifunctional DNA-formamidopyrimidine glycosylase/DNA-(apurinic or apyrimidinic site) lyase [Neisseria animalis]VEE08698.1 formamidopyrimidine-DNA glycosylase [Neisseria animalis]
MPELPEVETTLRGIEPHITGKTVYRVTVRQPKLRWPVHPDLAEILKGQTVLECSRRAKYLIIRFQTGCLLIHLGMSGSLRIFTAGDERAGAPDKHDHVDIVFADGTLLVYRDPRRFGAVLWYEGAAEYHPLLHNAGPEPLSPDFNGGYLYRALQKQKKAVKTALMDNALVVGVGNIYANESLFEAAISPYRPANLLSEQECETLAATVKDVLGRAIAAGGSTLRDFVNSDGKSGYFQQEYMVYGRAGEACRRCGTPVEKSIIGQRGTFYCAVCQK